MRSKLRGTHGYLRSVATVVFVGGGGEEKEEENAAPSRIRSVYSFASGKCVEKPYRSQSTCREDL